MALLAGRDRRTVTGTTMATIEAMTGLGIWTVGQDTLMEALTVATTVDIRPEHSWKIEYL